MSQRGRGSENYGKSVLFEWPLILLSCIASCGSNIYDHEVIKSYGVGSVTVSCSANNYVIGCGINPGKLFVIVFTVI